MLLYLVFVFILSQFDVYGLSNSVWHYECKSGACVKTETTDASTDELSLGECNILCLDVAGLWPKPTGSVHVSNLTQVTPDAFLLNTKNGTEIYPLLVEAFSIFRNQLNQSLPSRRSASDTIVYVHIEVVDEDSTILTLKTDEAYYMHVSQPWKNVVNVTIQSETFFGARHALETLSQLVVYDDLRGRILMASNVTIGDNPAYRWRGLILDTARNFIPVDSIKETLKGMAASKMNTFHWHITDSQSFPYVSKSRPGLALYGAYSTDKVYDAEDIKDVVEYARVRGIRVVPELDAPAHVGEGWQKYNVVTCFNWQPYSNYCPEPPCGQIDPSQDAAYDILEDLYGDMLEQFGTEIFHMGGDEVNINCWNSTDHLKEWMLNEKKWDLSRDTFIKKVWVYFQTEAARRLYNKAGKEIPVILWSSDLTSVDNVHNLLPPEKYYIQVWSSVYDYALERLLDKNYTVILSNYDTVYLDCGFGDFIRDDTNWCAPFKTWQQLYENKPKNVVGSKSKQVLGAEAALWTEISGPESMQTRIWPRAAALAEALWTESNSFWTEAENRFLLHRERLVGRGVRADTVKPEWCFRNQQQCTA